MPTPSGPAGGDLGGTYPNPTVISLEHAIFGPTAYPTGSAEHLTNIPFPPSIGFGYGNLDADGLFAVPAGGTWQTIVAMSADEHATGPLFYDPSSSTIISKAGALDAGRLITYFGIKP